MFPPLLSLTLETFHFSLFAPSLGSAEKEPHFIVCALILCFLYHLHLQHSKGCPTVGLPRLDTYFLIVIAAYWGYFLNCRNPHRCWTRAERGAQWSTPSQGEGPHSLESYWKKMISAAEHSQHMNFHLLSYVLILPTWMEVAGTRPLH